MKRSGTLLLLLGCTVLLVVAWGSAQTTPATKGTAWKIQNAMNAAPPAVSKHATIMDWPAREGDQPTVLRKETNEWSCFPDDSSTPGNDPMCVDRVW